MNELNDQREGKRITGDRRESAGIIKCRRLIMAGWLILLLPWLVSVLVFLFLPARDQLDPASLMILLVLGVVFIAPPASACFVSGLIGLKRNCGENRDDESIFRLKILGILGICLSLLFSGILVLLLLIPL